MSVISRSTVSPAPASIPDPKTTNHRLPDPPRPQPQEQQQLHPRRSAASRRRSKRVNALGWCMQRQLGVSLSVIVVVLAVNAASRAELFLSTRWTPAPSYHLRNPFSRFLYLSFRLPDSDLYYKGRDDAYFIAWWVVVFWFLREALMRWVLAPFARRSGIKEERNVVRFAEQGWSVFYYVIFWSLGLYIMQTSPYAWLNTREFYVGYPHIAISGLTKFYCPFPSPWMRRLIWYLAQTAFWVQQIIVINLEAKRKDYYQMFTHHIITTLLMMLSYIQNWTRIGTAILCTMDVADILLSVSRVDTRKRAMRKVLTHTFPAQSAKLIKYCDRPQAADVMFAVFLVVWIATRHVAFGMITYSVYAEAHQILEYDWRPQDGYFHSWWAMFIFKFLLTALQVLLVIWLGMILRVVWKMVVVGAVAEDIRSDDEAESEAEEDDQDSEMDNEKECELKRLVKGREKVGTAFSNGHSRSTSTEVDERPKALPLPKDLTVKATNGHGKTLVESHEVTRRTNCR
ncbi:BZ3500_MvSof-1268-A1-R1_Chr8-1g09905 [Microbotryum saponariae]|uniref:BZ3500_MvSof-1268-A1-R1_Chr8-1g09905 protein n=1 Tax=Microbotryum saponariae TaxID=289078 RepID=A0A2X0LM15_9BASI|nr:BZ3500_MvSof-1268-A1-R1_Chr8-1g09905 [Microbotryum saponariae]SDA08191.1 BZ3501_MvSof-1269-A2-R1_Chr8-1g09628 [Microbotryum saponariae]